jgi:hypothetical protein
LILGRGGAGTINHTNMREGDGAFNPNELLAIVLWALSDGSGR